MTMQSSRLAAHPRTAAAPHLLRKGNGQQLTPLKIQARKNIPAATEPGIFIRIAEPRYFGSTKCDDKSLSSLVIEVPTCK